MCALCFIFLANPTHAGLFSFLEKLLAEEKNPNSYNSQNLPILSSSLNLSAIANAIGGAPINFVEESSLLPVMGPMGSIADVDTYKLDQITTYTVQPGDSLSKIAKMFGVSVGTIYWANDLKRGDLIKEGAVLVILPVSGIQHEIKKGETIESIAKKYKSDAEEIVVFNSINPDDLKVGETIIIPNAELGLVPLYQTNIVRGNNGPNFAGYFVRPILGGRKSQGLHGYNGIDLATSCGSPVFASASGTVLVARSWGWNGGYGNYIVIAHPNGTQTVYAHLLGVRISVGQYTTQGSVIGSIGTTGHSTGCHLHFEIRGAKNPF